MAEERVIAAAESEDQPRRHLAGEVLLSRRLRSLQRIDDRREIDLEYVTCSEYQLFLDETLSIGKSFKPDHWDDVRFPKGSAFQPVTGVRPEDAVAFCEWLSERQGQAFKYRLPTIEEANGFPSREDGVTTWCVCESGYMLVTSDASWRTLSSVSESLVQTTKQTVFGGTRAEEHDLALAFIRALNLARASIPIAVRGYDQSDREFTLAFAFARDLANYIDVDLNRNVLRSREREETPARLALVSELALDLDLSRNLIAGASGSQIPLSDSVLHLLRIDETEQAQQLISKLESNRDSSIASKASLLNTLVAMSQAKSDEELRIHRRRYSELLLRYAEEGLPPRRVTKTRHVERKTLLGPPDLHAFLSSIRWWQQLAAGRREKKFPAWEGIRFIREVF